MPALLCLVTFVNSQSAKYLNAIAKTDENTTREQAIHNGWLDCISQLKRYWQVPGVVIATGLFIIQSTSEEEYEMERAERELVLI